MQPRHARAVSGGNQFGRLRGVGHQHANPNLRRHLQFQSGRGVAITRLVNNNAQRLQDYPELGWQLHPAKRHKCFRTIFGFARASLPRTLHQRHGRAECLFPATPITGASTASQRRGRHYPRYLVKSRRCAEGGGWLGPSSSAFQSAPPQGSRTPVAGGRSEGSRSFSRG